MSASGDDKPKAKKTEKKKPAVPKPKAKTQNDKDLDVNVAWDVVDILSERLPWQQWAVKNTVRLLDEDNTIPFIARYRKEQTNNMEADKIRELKDQLDGLRYGRKSNMYF